MSEVTPEPAHESPNAVEGVKPAGPESAQPVAAPAESAAPAEGKKEEPAKSPETNVTELGKPSVPEKYDLKLPEDSPLDASQLDKIASFAKERGLSQEQAQAVLEEQVSAVKGFVEAQHAHITKTTNAWFEEAKADKEIGGEAFNENAELAKRVVNKFGTEAFKTALNSTGLGNHPELMRVFARIGKSMANDQLVFPGPQAGGSKRSTEEILYGGGTSNS